MEVQLSGHLKTNDSRNPIKVLTTFDLDSVTRTDADVEVLTNRAEATADTTSVSQKSAQCKSRFLCMFGGLYIGCGCNLDQGHAQSIQGVDNLFPIRCRPRIQLSGTVLFQTDDIDPNRSSRCLNGAIGGDQSRSLEAAGV